MNITTALIALVSFVAGAIVALRYGVSISGMVRADLVAVHAKIESLKSHVTDETAKVTAKVESVKAAIKG